MIFHSHSSIYRFHNCHFNVIQAKKRKGANISPRSPGNLCLVDTRSALIGQQQGFLQKVFVEEKRCLEIIVDCAAKYYFKDLFPIKGVGRYPLNPCASFLNNFWGAGTLQSIDVKISLYRGRGRGQMQSD